MKVLFFAQCREATACAQFDLETAKPLTSEEFWALLVKIFPNLAAMQKSARLARDEVYLQEDELLRPEDEVAIIPPVSGG